MADLIDRQVAYDVLTDYYHHTTETQHKALKEALSRVPSAEPQIIACGEGELSTNSAEGGMDMVSRQAVIDAINEAMIGKTCDTDGTRMASITNEYVIKRLPSAWPEIIRCKDCQHRDEHGCCKHWKALSLSVIPIATDDDDFCSYAERRTDGQATE